MFSGGIYLASSLLASFLNFLFSLMAARCLPVTEFGELMALTGLYMIFSVSHSGVVLFVVRHGSGMVLTHGGKAVKNLISGIFRSLKSRIMLFLVIFAALLPACTIYLDASSWFGVAAVELAAAVGFVSAVYVAVLQSLRSFLWLSIVNVANAAVKIGLFLVLALFIPKAWFTSLSLAGAAVATLILGRAIFIRETRETASTETKEKPLSNAGIILDWKGMKATVLPILAVTGLTTVIGNIDVILVRGSMEPLLTGHYGALSQAGRIIFWVNSTVLTVLLPEICSQREDEGRAKLARKVALSLTILFSLIGILTLILFPAAIARMLFGSHYVAYSNSLWLFGVMSAILSLLSLETQWACAAGNFKVSYILLAVVIGMVAGAYSSGGRLERLPIVFSAIFAAGYCGAWFCNAAAHLRQQRRAA